jgi:hypothetical protein
MVRSPVRLFNLSLVKKPLGSPTAVNRRIDAADSIEPRATFPSSCVVMYLQQRIAVVGNRNIDVGNKSPTRKPDQPIVEHLAGTDGSSELRIDKQNPPKTERPGICGAMTQQGGDSGRGNQSAPQKFVQLVGCRDPKVRPEPWVRPRPAPAKR